MKYKTGRWRPAASARDLPAEPGNKALLQPRRRSRMQPSRSSSQIRTRGRRADPQRASRGSRIGLQSQRPIVDLAVRQTGDALRSAYLETRWMNQQLPGETLHRFGECRTIVFRVYNDAILFVHGRDRSHGGQQLLHVVEADTPSEELDEASLAPGDIKEPCIIFIADVASRQ